ncbi:acyltransferase [Paenibacillus albiflavus]|uniref:Acyltransferase n=1 Tax=Paenibacillus albiflavus TaxID=2545760 RepID=A0A4R4EGZ1_9BACL|nr:carbon-nitrogen hydrolase family protein [Paenibacillus albiflavus]TCZ78887.1 acyltransferase [Paenibacillus albiflavus]
MKMRVSAVQYHLHTIASFDEFAAQVAHYVAMAEEYEAEFVLFPELFTTQLLSIGDGMGKALPITALPGFTEAYMNLFKGLAMNKGMHIIGGTHIIEEEGKLYNAAFLFYPDGRVAEQRKIHITPAEIKEWNMGAGNGLEVFETDKGRIAILTCYDMEFPEIVRMAKAKGADVIFCPSCTDDRHGFHRVRYCCHARTIENQVYVVVTGTIGALPTVDSMRGNFGQAAVLTPNDVPFPPRGVLTEGEINSDMIITADLDLALLEEVRLRGTVTTWRDRRTDLYIDWK